MEKLKKARTRLLLTTDRKLVFLAHMLTIPDRLDESVETACTDGTVIRWNPAFVDSLSNDEVFGVLVHELMHIALLHTVIAKQYAGQFDLLNIAADLAINSMLDDAGIVLTADCMMPGRAAYAEFPAMKSMEWYMRELQQQEKNGRKFIASASGAIEPAGADAARSGDSITAELAAEQIRAKVKGIVGKLRGTESMRHIGDAITAALESKIDLRVYLRKFRTKITKGGSDWTRLNRRLGAVGVTAPTNRRRTVGNVCILLDVSGSIGNETLSQSLRETVDVFGQIAGDVVIVQHDTKVQRVDVWKRGQSMPEIVRAANGGTCHVQPFEAIEVMPQKFDCVIAFTDLDTRFPAVAPRVPVVWAVTPGATRKPPFGIVASNTL